METNSSKNRTSGIIYGILSYVVWGLLPLYWKLLHQMPAYEILAHRIFWSFIFVSLLLVFSRSIGKLKAAFKDKKSIIFIGLSSLLIGVNWFIYIWAVNSDHIVQASMGYYINPLMTVLLGTIVLKEKMNTWQYLALALAAVGVLSITIHYGSIPWVSLALAVSFALYGLCKKKIQVEASVGLALETMMLTPFAFVFLVFRQVEGTAAFLNSSTLVTILLLCAGVVTATPLLWFAMCAKRVELSTVGFLQYLSPTISLILGIAVFKEQFSSVHMVGFSFIWAGVAVYTLSQLSFVKRLTMQFKKVKGIEG